MRQLLTMLLLVVMPGALHAETASPGQKFRDTITNAGRTVPLLDGEWTTIAASASGSSGGSSHIERVYLAQVSGNRLSRWIKIETNDQWNPGGWKRDKAICDRSDTHFSYSDSNHNERDTECWTLNHLGMTAGKNPSQATIDFYRWSDALGRPNTAVCLIYFFAKRGDFLRVEYCFNPVVAGFRDTGGAGWRGNPWHPDIASKDPKKLAYLRELKTTGEGLFDKLKAVLK
jgi:hypothetical protein